MRRIVFSALLVVGSVAFAQPKSTRLCFVQSGPILEAHPEGPKIVAAKVNAEKELKPILEAARALQSKASAGSASAAERQQLDTLSKTIQATQRKWQSRIDALLKPVEVDVDKAIATTARALGCNVVLDRLAARNSALVVYADEDLDITQDVIKTLKNAK
jgi:outer membrane protein